MGLSFRGASSAASEGLVLGERVKLGMQMLFAPSFGVVRAMLMLSALISIKEQKTKRSYISLFALQCVYM